METIEIAVFLLFTMVVAGLVISFISGTDFGAVQKVISGIMQPQQNFENVQKMSSIQLVKRMSDCWEECSESTGSTECGNAVILDTDLNADLKASGLSKTYFESKFSELNFCTDCNLDIAGVIMPNTIIKLTCNENNSGQLKVYGATSPPIP